MINLNEMSSLPAYTTKEIVNFGVIYPKHTLYQCRFIRHDNLFLQTGVIKLLPLELSNFYTNYPVVLNAKTYKANAKVNPKDFDFNVLKTLLKTKVLKCELKEEIDEEKLNSIIQNDEQESENKEYVGKTFKQMSEILNIPYKTLKEAFGLKQGGQNKKVKKEDLEKFKELIGNK